MITVTHDSHLPSEIAAGYVLHLDPKRLLGLGAMVTGPSTTWVIGHHFFVCLEAGPKRCRMLPLFSNEGPGRIALSTSGRRGHEKWTGGTFHYHPGQIWTISRQAVARAAADGGDFSRPGSRNVLDDAFVPALPVDG